jgi:hypothetical protein
VPIFHVNVTERQTILFLNHIILLQWTIVPGCESCTASPLYTANKQNDGRAVEIAKKMKSWW